ncbi:porin, partial [Leptospira borgpetersenii serovar Hardjo-bovis]|nr:porin [Leptospira borgpetersenii serovar Hardjo-bovis]
YEFDGFSVIGGYGAADRTNAQESLARGKGAKAEQWATGVKYDANNIYLAAQYSQTYNATRFGTSNGDRSDIYGFADKAQNFEVVAQYQFDFGLRPSVAY